MLAKKMRKRKGKGKSVLQKRGSNEGSLVRHLGEEVLGKGLLT